MQDTGTAYFARRPRRADELMQPHLLEEEREYRVVQTVLLPDMDYDNFVTDLLADREFLEPFAGLCSRGEVWDCLRVALEDGTESILVMPEDGCYVGWAAEDR